MIILSILFIFKTIYFLHFTQVAHSTFLVGTVTVLISLFLSFFIAGLAKKRWKLYLGIFYTIFSAIVFADTMYFSYFNMLPSVKMLAMTTMLGDVTGSLLSLINFKSLLPLLDLPLFYLYLIFSKKDIFSKKGKLLIALAAGLLVSGLFFAFTFKSSLNTLYFQEFYSYHVYDIYKTKFAKKVQIEKKNPYSQKDIDFLKERTAFKEGNLTGLAKGKNLIVVQVEALQNFVIGLEYNGQEITPNLNKLIKDQASIYYSDYYQLLGRGNTSDAEFVSNNSLHPSMESPTYSQYADNTFYGLPRVLRDAGYSAWAFHGYEKDFWNRNYAYIGQGFERFLSEEDYQIGDVIELGLADQDFYQQSMTYLKDLQAKDKPFYAFMVSLSSHNPFSLPEKYKEIDLLEDHKDTILGDYLNSIHYADKALGQFIEDLKEEGLYDQSLLAIYGDHFAIPNSSKEIIDMMNDFFGKKYNYDLIMNVPLIINCPGADLGYTEEKLGSQIDFMPTILNLLGVENKKGLMFGVDLNNYEGYNNVKAQTIMRKGSFIDKDTIFIVSATELFDDFKAEKRPDYQNTDIYQYRDIYDQVIYEINFSNYILANDLIKNLVQGKDLFASIEDQKKSDLSQLTIVKSKDNSLDDIKTLADSNKYIGVNFSYNLNRDRLVLDDKDQSLMEYLYYWLSSNENVVLAFNTDEEDHEIYRNLRFEIPQAKANHLLIIPSFDKYYFAQSNGFENIIIDLRGQSVKDSDLKDFISAHQLYGLIVDQRNFNINLLEDLYNKGILVFYETNGSYKILDEY
ncbi:MAG: sulfatase-like hydrolase/transferase [Bacillota bacterium]|nr:sulfatase-like hydrolase/transferase [Bacillota bacterium]